MRIALVYPSDNLMELKNTNQDKTMAEFFGQYPHLGLATIAACLIKAGHTVTIIEGNALCLSYKDMIEKLREFKPDLMGFSATTQNFPNIINAIKHFKRYVDVPVVVGGPHFTYYPRESLNCKEIDYVVMGDGVETIVQLVRALENGEKDLCKIDGLGYRSGKKIVVTNPARKIMNLDEIPWPARELLPNEKYFNFLSRRMNATVFYTETGCPGNCIFCDRGTGRELYRSRSAANIFEEMKHSHDTFGIREILFYDATFTTNRKKVIELCNQIVKNKLDIEWSCSARVDRVDFELLRIMKQAGCRRIQYGIETINPVQARIIKKIQTSEQVARVINLTRKAGISPLGFFMLGLPKETEETMEDNIRFALSLDIDYASFSLTRSFPNTELYEWQMAELGYDYWARYILGDPKSIEKLGLYGTALCVSRVEEKIREAYWRFYFRPIQVYRIARDMKSFIQFKRYVLAAIHFTVRFFLRDFMGIGIQHKQKRIRRPE